MISKVRKRKDIIFLLLILTLCRTPNVWAWAKCDVTLEIPHGAIEVGESITVVAKGSEAGGSYDWYNYPYILPNGSTAIVIGTKPLYSDYLKIGVSYSAPAGGRCFDTGWLWMKPSCDFSVSGMQEMPLFGTPIEVTATPSEGTNGSFSWSGATSVSGNDRLALFTGTEPGKKTVEATYATDEGASCSQNHDVTVYKVQKIEGPSCANVGENFITKFKATTEPAGYEENVSITNSPPSIHQQKQQEITILGSVTEGRTEDDATTIMQLIDPDVAAALPVPVVGVNFNMPNFLEILLDKLKAKGEDAGVKVSYTHTKNISCCDNAITNGYNGGNLSFALSPKRIEISPKKLIPATGKMKKYLDYIPDVIKIIITAKGSLNLVVRNDEQCNDLAPPIWSGEGNLGASIALALADYEQSFAKGTITVKTSLSASTALTEKFSIESPNTLVAAGGWGNITASGVVMLTTLRLIDIKQSFSVELLEANPITTRVPLPNILN